MTNSRQQRVFRWTALPARLIAAIVIGIAIFVLFFPARKEMRLLLAYDLALSTYLALLIVRLSLADEAATRDLAERKEPSNTAVVVSAALLSMCSLAGVGFMLQRSQAWTTMTANMHLGLSLLAVLLSWTLLHAAFGIHYARLYYDPTPSAGDTVRGTPLEFPGNIQPDFWDFMYFSFTLAVCYQVSDVTIHSRHVRRVALGHMLLSFLNVTMILGIVVEIIASITGASSSRR